MENNKGDLLNQLALISDLIEKMNIKSESTTIVIDLDAEEFKKTFDYFEKKYDRKMDKPKDSFKMSIGKVEVIFNTSSV